MDLTQYLDQILEIIIDRPLGNRHPIHGYIYPINYGYLPDTKAPDGEEIDAYLLGVFRPTKSFKGKCIAIAHRDNDDDDKLIIAPQGKSYTPAQIAALTEFQERFFKTRIITKED